MTAASQGYIVEGGRSDRGRLRELWARRGVLWSFTLREVQVRYRQAALGFAWALLQPAALTLASTLVFHALLRVEVPGGDYPVFVFTGLLAWTYFHTALTGAVPTLVNNAGLVRKIWFPREALPLATVLAVLLDLGVALATWLVLLLVRGPAPGPAVLWALPLLGILVLFTAACALFGAAVNVRWRDVKHGLPLLLQLAFFATPIVYPLALVPASARPWLELNPLCAVVEGLREAALAGHAPDAARTLLGLAVAAVALVAARAVFARAERRFADVI